MKYFILLILIGVCIYACEPPSDKRLTISNYSSEEWLIAWGLSDTLPEQLPFPYLLTPEKYPIDCTSVSFWHGGREDLWRRNETKAIIPGNGRWEGRISRSKQEKMRLFLFLPKTIEINDWKDIKERKLWDRKYNLSIDTLKKINWNIIIK